MQDTNLKILAYIISLIIIFLILTGIVMWTWNSVLPYAYPMDPKQVLEKRKLPFKVALLVALFLVVFFHGSTYIISNKEAVKNLF